jgi:nitrogenase molybdenum-cofactor synthesis protein NifE
MSKTKKFEIKTLDERKDFIVCNQKNNERKIKCEKNSAEGAVSQRACVYCGARVVLNPITDAVHIVHGPIGCASYTWDIRGSLTSGADYYRSSFSTDLKEHDIIFGGERKLSAAIDEIVEKYKPEVIFVYSTCVVGVIGDDLEAVCKNAVQKHNIKVIPVQSTGFAGNKSSGYRAACDALLTLMENSPSPLAGEGWGEGLNTLEKQNGINILGEFNLAGEIWILKNYLKKIGIKVVSKITGDATCSEIQKAPTASFNIVQCAGSMMYLAKKMEEKYSIPFIKISFFGIEDTVNSLVKIAFFTQDKEIMAKAKVFTDFQAVETNLKLEKYRKRLNGKRAAIYVGGGFKAISLIKQFNDLGIKTVLVGTQTGKEEDYETIESMTDEGTVIIDDANPSELEKLIKRLKADILVGGVKERPLAYKLGVAFCDHNHERKEPLCGFEGALNFAKEVDNSINSPVWKHVKGGGEL